MCEIMKEKRERERERERGDWDICDERERAWRIPMVKLIDTDSRGYCCDSLALFCEELN